MYKILSNKNHTFSIWNFYKILLDELYEEDDIFINTEVATNIEVLINDSNNLEICIREIIFNKRENKVLQ